MFTSCLLRLQKPPCEVKPLPTEIIADILSRLPATHVVKFRSVCKEWKLLISSPNFVELHLQRASNSPTLIFHRWSIYYEPQLFFIDEFGDEANNIKPKLRKVWQGDRRFGIEKKYLKNLRKNTVLSFSCNGLLFFTSSVPVLPWKHLIEHITVLNPVTRDKINISYRTYGQELCGFYFVPKDDEVRVLWLSLPKRGCVTITILCMGSHSYELRRKSKHQVFNAMPRNWGPPVNLNGALHWISATFYTGDNDEVKRVPWSKTIMTYSIEKEEFCCKPHPEPPNICPIASANMHLLSINGQLSYCRISDITDIWILDDYNKWSWSKSHQIDLNSIGMEIYPYFVEVLGIQKGALVFKLWNVGLIAYHLEEKTVKKFMFKLC